MDDPFGRASTRSSCVAFDQAGNRSARTPAIPIAVRYVALGRNRIAAAAGAPFAVRVSSDARAGALDARRPQRLRATGHAPASRAAAEGALHADGLRQRAHGARRRVRPGAGALTELARLAGPLGCLGLALLFVATRRELRLAGLVAWAVGLAGSASTSRRTGAPGRCSRRRRGGLVAAAAGAWLLAAAGPGCSPSRRWPASRSGSRSTSATRTRTCSSPSMRSSARSRSRSAGSSCAATTAPASSGRSRWPLAAVVGWTGLALLWTDDLRQGAIFLAAFVLPFGLLASASRGCPSAAERCSASSAPSSRPRSPMRASASTSGRRERSSGTRSCGSTTRTRPSSASTRSSGTRRSTAATSSSRSSRRSRSSCSACGTAPRRAGSSRSPRSGSACSSRSRSRASPR